MSEERDDIPESSKRKAHEVNLADASCEFSPIKKPRPDGDPPPPNEVPNENMARAMPRALMPERSHCFSKTLSQDEVSRDSRLQLEALQARHLESSRRRMNEPFMVFDGDGRQCRMNLACFFHRVQGSFYFLDNPGWQSFVQHHNLRAGDTIHVHKVLDQSVCDDYYFVITYSRLGMEF